MGRLGARAMPSEAKDAGPAAAIAAEADKWRCGRYVGPTLAAVSVHASGPTERSIARLAIRPGLSVAAAVDAVTSAAAAARSGTQASPRRKDETSAAAAAARTVAHRAAIALLRNKEVQILACRQDDIAPDPGAETAGLPARVPAASADRRDHVLAGDRDGEFVGPWDIEGLGVSVGRAYQNRQRRSPGKQ